MKRSGRNSAQKIVYRFKIWTRKSYSVFNSLGKLISIGFLATSVSERVGAKSKSSLHKLNFLKNDSSHDDDSGGTPLESTAFEEMLTGFLASFIILLVPQPQRQECCSRKIPGDYFQFTPSFLLLYLVLSPFPSSAFHSIYLLINNKSQTIYSNQTICYGTGMFKIIIDTNGNDYFERRRLHIAIKKPLEKYET